MPSSFERRNSRGSFTSSRAVSFVFSCSNLFPPAFHLIKSTVLGRNGNSSLIKRSFWSTGVPGQPDLIVGSSLLCLYPVRTVVSVSDHAAIRNNAPTRIKIRKPSLTSHFFIVRRSEYHDR